MKKRTLAEAPRRIRNGLVSSILLQSGDTQKNNLALTWVEIEAGHRQVPHSHAPEQAYVIVSGRGRMQVGNDFSEVKPGDMIFIPSNEMHGIENNGTEKLVYLSAASPAFDLEALYDSGQLKDEGWDRKA